ncbi:MAG: glycosyltransferase family 4 protein, partial [candidate division KSB1 bacterium]
HAVKDFLIKGRSVSKEKIQVIWNGINLAAYRRANLQSAAQFRARFATREQKLIGMVGRLREEKGNRYFIQAAREILQHMPDARFVLMGEGEERAQLERLTNELGVREKLHFAGFVNDVQAALHACDVVVIPSLREGFGLILAEAMAAERPIVATRVGGMIEMAQHEQQVLFVPPANSSALAQAALRLMQDQNLAARLASAAREHSENFSIEKNVAALEALYSKLAAKQKLQARSSSNYVIPQESF